MALVIMAIIVLFGIFSSCTPQLYKNQINVTHVLALTEEGDTIKIPINQIKPNVIYNVIGYDYYRPYRPWYYSNNFYHPSYNYNYKPKPNTNPSTPLTNNVITKPNPVIINNAPNPVKTNPKKNN